MLNNLLNMFMFLADTTTEEQPTNGWTTWVFLGVVVVLMIVLLIVPQRRNKKKQEEMMNKLAVGAIVTTIGGIIGVVTRLDPNGHIFLETGSEESKTTMEFTKGAIYMIQSANELKAAEKVEEKKEDEVDEIK